MSMTLQHTLEARTKEMHQIRAEGAEMWTRLHAPSTLLAERRELRGAVTAKQEALDAINDEIKVLTAQWEREAARLTAQSAEPVPGEF